MTSLKDMKEQWAIRRKNVEELLKPLGQEYPECGFDIGDGWMPIVMEALTEMSKVDVKWQLSQVKQKFCGLRIYVDFERSEHPPWIFQEEHPEHIRYLMIQKIIGEAEKKCAVACENCGALHSLTIPRAGTALCSKCQSVEVH